MALKSDMTFSLFLVVAVGYWAQQTEGATVQSIYTRIKAKKQTFLWTSILTMYK